MNLSGLAVKIIIFYQLNLSSRKKFCCAHGVLHRGLTCSEYSKQKILELGFIKGIQMTLVRFKECYFASRELNQIRKNPEKHSTKSKDDPVEFCTGLLMASDAACCLLSFLPF